MSDRSYSINGLSPRRTRFLSRVTRTLGRLLGGTIGPEPEHPDTALWRERCQAYERIADIFAARLERQPGRNARGRYCKR